MKQNLHPLSLREFANLFDLSLRDFAFMWSRSNRQCLNLKFAFFGKIYKTWLFCLNSLNFLNSANLHFYYFNSGDCHDGYAVSQWQIKQIHIHCHCESAKHSKQSPMVKFPKYRNTKSNKFANNICKFIYDTRTRLRSRNYVFYFH